MNISTQTVLMDSSGPYGSTFDIVVDPSARYGPGSSILVFAAAEQPAALGSDMTLTVTDAFDFTLAIDEGYSLPHIGCRIGDAYAPDVVAVIGPPVDSADRGQISPARLAWQYNRDGLTSIDANNVRCELAGEEQVSPNPRDLSDGPVVPQLVGEVGTAEPGTEIDRFGNVQLPPGSHVTGISSVGLPDGGYLETASLIFLEIPDRPFIVLLAQRAGEHELRVLSGLDIPLSADEAVTQADCHHIPVGALLTVTLKAQEGDVEAIRAWSFDSATTTFAQVDASRVTCTFSHV